MNYDGFLILEKGNIRFTLYGGPGRGYYNKTFPSNTLGSVRWWSQEDVDDFIRNGFWKLDKDQCVKDFIEQNLYGTDIV